MSDILEWLSVALIVSGVGLMVGVGAALVAAGVLLLALVTLRTYAETVAVERRRRMDGAAAAAERARR